MQALSRLTVLSAPGLVWNDQEIWVFSTHFQLGTQGVGLAEFVDFAWFCGVYCLHHCRHHLQQRQQLKRVRSTVQYQWHSSKWNCNSNRVCPNERPHGTWWHMTDQMTWIPNSDCWIIILHETCLNLKINPEPSFWHLSFLSNEDLPNVAMPSLAQLPWNLDPMCQTFGEQNRQIQIQLHWPVCIFYKMCNWNSNGKRRCSEWFLYLSCLNVCGPYKDEWKKRPKRTCRWRSDRIIGNCYTYPPQMTQDPTFWAGEICSVIT